MKKRVFSGLVIVMALSMFMTFMVSAKSVEFNTSDFVFSHSPDDPETEGATGRINFTIEDGALATDGNGWKTAIYKGNVDKDFEMSVDITSAGSSFNGIMIPFYVTGYDDLKGEMAKSKSYAIYIDHTEGTYNFAPRLSKNGGTRWLGWMPIVAEGDEPAGDYYLDTDIIDGITRDGMTLTMNMTVKNNKVTVNFVRKDDASKKTADFVWDLTQKSGSEVAENLDRLDIPPGKVGFAVQLTGRSGKIFSNFNLGADEPPSPSTGSSFPIQMVAVIGFTSFTVALFLISSRKKSKAK